MPGPPLLGSCTLPSGVSLSPGVWLVRAIDPVNCPVGLVLEFLQERLTSGAAATTLRVYVAAIAAWRELDEVPLGRHRMVSHRGAFLRLLVFRRILLGA